jgi:peptidyl-prolyl cis-trans isomerase D
MMVLIFPSFVFFGIQGYERFMGQDNALAKVAGQPISQPEFDNVMRQRADQLRQMFGNNFDPRILETQEARIATLDSLLGDKALAAEAAREHLVVSENRLREVIAAIPAFQQDGGFNYDRYKATLAAQGRSELAFEQALRDDLGRQTLLQSIGQSAFVPKQVLDRLQRLGEETRVIREQRFDAVTFMAKANIGDEAIQKFYDANRPQFETAESARVEYVVFTLDDVAAQIEVPEAEVRDSYEKNQSRYGEGEQRRASHILFTVGDNGSAKDKAGARKLADETLAKLRKSSNDFARLARELSKDPGSAANGGDLGLFGHGMMVKPFEDVAFKLKAGEISDVVETDFGFHIIRVTEIKPAQTRPFDEVKPQILAELRRDKAGKRYAEAAEQFTNLVYEQSDSLKPAADKLKLTIKTADRVTRSGVATQGGEKQIFVPRLIEAVFSDDALKNKRNTEAIEVGPNALAAARVLEHRPAAQRPLAEVKDLIRQRLQRDEAVRLAREAAEARLADLRKTPDEKGFGAQRTVSRNAPENLSPAALNAVMRVSADKLPAYVSADNGAGIVAVFNVLSAAMPEKVDAARRAGEQRGLEQLFSTVDDQLYLEALKTKHKAVVLKSEFKRAPAAPVASK